MGYFFLWGGGLCLVFTPGEGNYIPHDRPLEDVHFPSRFLRVEILALADNIIFHKLPCPPPPPFCRTTRHDKAPHLRDSGVAKNVRGLRSANLSWHSVRLGKGTIHGSEKRIIVGGVVPSIVWCQKKNGTGGRRTGR